jgi:plastocyanin
VSSFNEPKTVSPDATRLDVTATRRRMLQLLGATGLAVTATSALTRQVFAGGSAARFGGLSRFQDGTPEAMPMATPVIGAQADGSTLWKVLVGGMDMENAIEYHGFFPGEITINAGDSIWFAYDMPMFHTVTFPGPEEVPAILIPDPEAEASGTPAAGPPKLILNPIVVTGAGGNMVDGSQLVSSPVDVFADPSIPFVFTFPTAGTYDYFCVPHASVMQAKVIVQEAGSELPMDQAAIDALAAEQQAAVHEIGLADIAKYSEPVSTEREDGTTLWEVAAGAGGATQARVQRFLPSPIEIAVGDTVKFINQSEGEPHTISFLGEGETAPEDTLVEQFADGTPKLVQNMETFLPQGGNTWSGTGFLNSGFTGIPQLGLPMEFEVTFDTEGEFIVYCILHGTPDGQRMAAPLIVGPAG